MAMNTCEILSNGTKRAFFFQKIITNRPAAGVFAPRPLSVIRLSYTTLFKTSPNADIFKPSPLAKSLSSAKNRPLLLIFHSAVSLSHKKFLFRKFLWTSLHAVCGLAPLHPIKNLGYAYAQTKEPPLLNVNVSSQQGWLKSG